MAKRARSSGSSKNEEGGSKRQRTDFGELTRALAEAEARVAALRAAVGAHPLGQLAARRREDALLAERLPRALHAELIGRELSEDDGALRALTTWLKPGAFCVDGRATRWYWHCRVVMARSESEFEVHLKGDLRAELVEPDDFAAVDLVPDAPGETWRAALRANGNDVPTALAALCFAYCEAACDFTRYPRAKA